MQTSKLNNQIKKLMREHPDMFPTEAKFWSYLRGCLRRGLWEKSAMKHRFKQSKMSPPPKEYTGRGKKGAYCALSDEWEMTSKLEVDHKDGNKRLLSEEDIIPYIVHLLASGEDELDVVKSDMHKVKSYADKQGITFDQAKRRKQVIAFEKKPLTEQIKHLQSLDIALPAKQTKKACKELYEKYLEDNV